MTIIQIAEKLHIAPQVVEREGIKALLEKKLLQMETELLLLARKYTINTISDFLSAIKKGMISETEDSREDFFRFDYLEAERGKIDELLQSL